MSNKHKVEGVKKVLEQRLRSGLFESLFNILPNLTIWKHSLIGAPNNHSELKATGATGKERSFLLFQTIT